MGTVAEDATAELVVLPVSERCGSCGNSWHSDDIQELCPNCGAADIELTGGEELVLELIEYRV
jgi:hydrogenase nickel incorporation protein HypA/HybF